MRWIALLIALAAVGMVPVAAATDGAIIVDSGSTNSLGYRIHVWTNGTASLTVQNRGGVAQAAAKSFSVKQSTSTRLFADLKAARDGNATGAGCMKSASFGTTTRITWHDWTSPDLDCPAGNALTAALVHDVGEIRAASGIDTMPLHRGVMPIRPMPVQAPPAAPSPAATPT
jgi:hypothetical protein